MHIHVFLLVYCNCSCKSLQCLLLKNLGVMANELNLLFPPKGQSPWLTNAKNERNEGFKTLNSEWHMAKKIRMKVSRSPADCKKRFDLRTSGLWFQQAYTAQLCLRLQVGSNPRPSIYYPWEKWKCYHYWKIVKFSM